MKQFFNRLFSPFHRLIQRFGGTKARTDRHEVERILGSLAVFSNMSPKQLARLAATLIARQHKAGEVFIRKGDKGLGMFIIATGRVEVYDILDGRKVTLSILDKGSCVGEMSLIDAQPRSASVQALEDCNTFLLTRDSFTRLFRRDPEILWGIVPILTERLRQTSDKVSKLSKNTVDEQAEPASAAVSGAGMPTSATDADEKAAHITASDEQAEPASAAVSDTVAAANEANADSEEVEKAKQLEIIEVANTMAQLASTSFMFFTSAILVNAQSNLRLFTRKDTLRENIEKRANLLNALTEHAEEDMDEVTKKLYGPYQNFLNSLGSILDKD